LIVSEGLAFPQRLRFAVNDLAGRIKVLANTSADRRVARGGPRASIDRTGVGETLDGFRSFLAFFSADAVAHTFVRTMEVPCAPLVVPENVRGIVTIRVGHAGPVLGAYSLCAVFSTLRRAGSRGGDAAVGVLRASDGKTNGKCFLARRRVTFNATHSFFASFLAYALGHHEEVIGAAAIFNKVAASHEKTFAVSSAIVVFPFAIVGRGAKLIAFNTTAPFFASFLAYTFGHHEEVIGAAAIFNKLTASHGKTVSAVSSAIVVPSAIVGRGANRIAYHTTEAFFASFLAYAIGHQQEDVIGAAAIFNKVAAAHGKTFAVSSAMIVVFPFAIVGCGAKLIAFNTTAAFFASFLAYAFGHHEEVIGAAAIFNKVAASHRETDAVSSAVVIGLEAISGSIARSQRVRPDAIHKTLPVVALHPTHAGGNRENIALGKAIVDGGASGDRFADPIRGAEHFRLAFRLIHPTVGVGGTFSCSDEQRRQDFFFFSWSAEDVLHDVFIFGGHHGAVDAADAGFAKSGSHAHGRCENVGRIFAVRDLVTFAHLEAGVGQGATVHIFRTVLDCRTGCFHASHRLGSYEAG